MTEAYIIESTPEGFKDLKTHCIWRRSFHSSAQCQEAVREGAQVFPRLEQARAQVREYLLTRKRQLEEELERIEYNLDDFEVLYAAPDSMEDAVTARRVQLTELFSRARSFPGQFHFAGMSVTNTVQPPGSAGLFEMALFEHGHAEPFTQAVCEAIGQAMLAAGLVISRQWYGVGHWRWSVLTRTGS